MGSVGKRRVYTGSEVELGYKRISQSELRNVEMVWANKEPPCRQAEGSAGLKDKRDTKRMLVMYLLVHMASQS